VLVFVLVAGLIAGGVLWRSRRGHILTEADTIVLADFTNTTGDAVFDDTLKQALSVELGQSPFLNLLPDQKIRDTLKLMGRSPGEKLTPDLARDLCLRTASKVYIGASITSLGGQYVMGLNAINCQTGDSVTQEQVTADKKEHVLRALDAGVSKLRKKLGESLGNIQRFNVSLDQATTSSLEALKAFSLGSRITNEQGDAEAIPFLKRAIELDPNFAMAYTSLATSYYNLGQGSLSVENTKKAYELRDRVSEREKLVISANYAGIVRGDLLQEIQAYELWEQIYPRDYAPHTNLGADYASLGQYGKSVEEARRSLALQPNNAFPYFNMAQSYFALNHFADAEAAFKQLILRTSWTLGSCTSACTSSRSCREMPRRCKKKWIGQQASRQRRIGCIHCRQIPRHTLGTSKEPANSHVWQWNQRSAAGPRITRRSGWPTQPCEKRNSISEGRRARTQRPH
jgi:eukaryotic-like serine/threonine-protein kinase